MQLYPSNTLNILLKKKSNSLNILLKFKGTFLKIVPFERSRNTHSNFQEEKKNNTCN